MAPAKKGRMEWQGLEDGMFAAISVDGKNKKCPCGDSNADIHLRGVALYPLSYRGATARILP